MVLKYDFDMYTVMPEDLQDNLGTTGVLPKQIAMFRDPEAIAAITRADEAVRAFFLDSGFGMKVYTSGAPPGRFPARDEVARTAVIEKLAANLATHNLEGADWGGFEFPKFMKALAAAKTLDDDSLLAPSTRSHRQLGDTATRASPRQNQTRRMVALGGLTIGLVLLFYVAAQILL